MAKHTYVIEADSVDEFKKHVHDLHHMVHGSAVAAITPPTVVPRELIEPEAKAPTRKHKKEVESPVAPPPPVAPPAAETDDGFLDVEEKQYSQAEVREIAKKTAERTSMAAVKDIVKALGATTMAELKPEKFGEFVAACEKLCASAK